jgi:hypothetical protein
MISGVRELGEAHPNSVEMVDGVEWPAGGEKRSFADLHAEKVRQVGRTSTRITLRATQVRTARTRRL